MRRVSPAGLCRPIKIAIRSLRQRAEGRIAIAPIEETLQKERIFEILNLMLADHRQGWEMKNDGTYVKRKSSSVTPTNKKDLGTHTLLMQKARNRG